MKKIAIALTAITAVFLTTGCSGKAEEKQFSVKVTEKQGDKTEEKTATLTEGKEKNVLGLSLTVSQASDTEYVINTADMFHEVEDEGGYYLTDGFNVEQGETINLETNESDVVYSVTVE